MVTLLHNMTCVGSISQNCQLNEKHCLTEIMTYSTIVRRVMKWKGNAMYGINVRLVIQVTVNTRHKLKFPIPYNICSVLLFDCIAQLTKYATAAKFDITSKR